MLRRNADATAVMPTETSGAVLVVPGVALPALNIPVDSPTPVRPVASPLNMEASQPVVPVARIDLSRLPAPVGPPLTATAAVEVTATPAVGVHRAPSSRRNLFALVGVATAAAAGGAYYLLVLMPGMTG